MKTPSRTTPGIDGLSLSRLPLYLYMSVIPAVRQEPQHVLDEVLTAEETVCFLKLPSLKSLYRPTGDGSASARGSTARRLTRRSKPIRCWPNS